MRPIDGILTGTITLGQSGPGSNGNEGTLYFLQSSGTGASPSNAVIFWTYFNVGESYSSAGDTVSVF